MAGITSTLNIAKLAIAAQQYGLNVSGHNIANVNNPDFARQNADHVSTTPAMLGGFLFGTGVNVHQVEQTVDQLLENRLTDEIATQAAFTEAESYMKIIEGFFDENSDTSMNSLLSDYWNAWHDLSDNPLGSSERVQVYEKGIKLAERFNDVSQDLDQVSTDITSEISSTVISINAITSQIADLNREIIGQELNRTANDLRDHRNGLIDELGKLINLDIITQSSGAIIVNAANGATIVNGVDSYNLSVNGGEVFWQGSYGSTREISDDISGGKLSGWLDIRDEIIPKYRGQIDELSRDMIWAVNYQHSQGAGLEYFKDSITGHYSVDESGWLTSYEFGDKLDFTQDFTIWTEDTSTVDTIYNKTVIDMGVSDATISNWQGMAPGSNQVRYKLTVVDDAQIGNQIVTQTNGDRLAEIWATTSGGASTALDSVLSDQTLTVYGSATGTHTIEIKDVGGDAKRSAASIAEELNKIGGISAFASKNEAEFDISGISSAEDGDEVQFSLYVDGQVFDRSFVVDSTTGTLAEQFEDELVAAAVAVNDVNSDNDLYADGLKITSDKGATLGVQDFEVQDNAGVRLSNFNNFDLDDTVSFLITTDGIPTTSTTISVDLDSISDVSDQTQMSTVFYNAISAALSAKPISVVRETSSDSIVLRTTDGSNITLRDAGFDSGNDATIALAELSGTSSAVGNTSLQFTALANDIETFNSLTTSGDTVSFGMPSTITTAVTGTTATIDESTSTSGANTTAAVISGTVTALLDEGMSIQSSVQANTGLFGTTGTATTGSSIMTLGGEDGFSNFDDGDVISFDVDGNTVSFTVTAGAGTTEIGLAQQLVTELNADISSSDYTFIRNGKSVSIIKAASLEDPIEITNFLDTGTGDAALAVNTGTGNGTNSPENDLLESGNTYRDFSTSSLYDDEGIILWEKFDINGDSTGSRGLITVEDKETVSIVENGSITLSFDLSEGALVAGNTLTINTDTSGNPDPLNLEVARQASSVNDIYQFEITNGGKVGHVPATGTENITVEWKSSFSSGSFEIEGKDPPLTPLAPVEVEIDGMFLNFYDGTLFTGDVFTITTDEYGYPSATNTSGNTTGETMSDWHWTLDSFVDQINKNAGGMEASATLDGELKLDASDSYYVLENVELSEQNGFSNENTTVTVRVHTALDFSALVFKLGRAAGDWGVLNDAAGGVAQIIPDGGDDDGFKVDLSGDGLADIEIKFTKQVTGDGYVKFDLLRHDEDDIGFALGDNASTSSGIMAAAGINTFYKGYDALTMEINTRLADTRLVAAAMIDSSTGTIPQGDNTNSLAVADVQYAIQTMKQWTYTRESGGQSSLITSSFDDYYNTMMGSLGVQSRSIITAREFADIMVNQLTEQRDAVSAVSLDEEMIKLMKYQHAFSAASKLLTIADEMLTTLISVR